jgi:lipopolysaccharide transport system permease protein
LVVPVSVVLSTLVQFLIQILLFAAVWGWYLLNGAALRPHWWLMPVLTPLLLVLMGALGLGSGILVSALTTKYRDFTFLVAFGVQLLMYATPVIYPLSMVAPRWKWLVELNPMTAPVEAFRAIYLGGQVPWTALGISVVVTAVILLLGTVVFNRVERTFMDTV